MRNDQVPPSATTPILPRWVRGADVLTVLLAVAALQAALFGGFQIPGLSVRNPWRPLVMALVIAVLRHGLVRAAPLPERLRRWICRVWLTDAVRAAWARAVADRMERWPPMDLKFFRALDFLVLAVVSISFTAVALLALNRFDARFAVTAGLILATAIRCFTPARFDAEHASAGKPIAPVLLLVLLTGLLFRTEPFLSLAGGQDQGVYVSMSAHLQREGSAFVDDRLPDALPDQRSRDIYRAGLPADPEGGSAVLPGLYHSPTRGDYVFQFYHLHPLWMATFAELFGDRARFHALGFFGLLGVLGLSLLAFELTGSRRAAFAAGILVATNPLHVFFSRFPVSEAVALAFSSLGFYYLARAFRGAQNAAPPATTASLVTLAAACVSLVFFVRITGFLYLPALVPLFGLGAWLTLRNRRPWGRRIIGFCAAVATLYGVSVLYGLGYSPGYALSVYDRTFGNLLGDGWPLVTAGAAALAVAGLAEIARNPRRPAVRRLLVLAADPRPWIKLGSLVIGAALAGSFLQAYWIGFTDRYADDPFYRGFGIVGSGAGIFLQSGAMGWLLYVSPWLAGIALWGMHRPPRRWPVALLYVFLAGCMAATLLLNVPVIYQHYYYARYLLSEIVPYSLVIAVAVSRTGQVPRPGRNRDRGRDPVPTVLHGEADAGPGGGAALRGHGPARRRRWERRPPVRRRRVPGRAGLLDACAAADAADVLFRHARLPLLRGEPRRRRRAIVRGRDRRQPTLAAQPRPHRSPGAGTARDLRLPGPENGQLGDDSREHQRALLAADPIPVPATLGLRRAGLRVEAPRPRSAFPRTWPRLPAPVEEQHVRSGSRPPLTLSPAWFPSGRRRPWCGWRGGVGHVRCRATRRWQRPTA